ncbi:MAG: RNA methyltransferase [Bacilli bacterium]|nr:RNA methyltransferase [Bacilli bacterium]
MKEITSLNNEYIKYLYKLKDKKNRYKENKFIIEGFHLVEEAYKSNSLLEILTINELSNYNDVNQIIVNETIIEKLSTTKNPQGVIGICEMKKHNQLLGEKLLILDNINDPGNMGTLIRSSLGFDIDTIIISEDCVDIYNEKTIRATQGSFFNSNIYVSDDLEATINELKQRNIKIIGTSLQSSINLKDIKNIDNYAILLGNEANGVKEKLLNLTDMNVKIEMNKKLESLNVAVAGSIIMYYLNN